MNRDRRLKIDSIAHMLTPLVRRPLLGFGITIFACIFPWHFHTLNAGKDLA